MAKKAPECSFELIVQSNLWTQVGALSAVILELSLRFYCLSALVIERRTDELDLLDGQVLRLEGGVAVGT